MPRAEKSSDFRNIRDAAEEQGWVVEKTRKNHWRFVPPDREHSPVIFSGSPGDFRAFQNFISALRQRGFKRPRRNNR